jgi:hypothetical protein
MTAIRSEAAIEHAPGRRHLRLRHAVTLAAMAWLLVLGPVTARVAAVDPVSSDDATGVLEAGAVLRGNLLLRGWWLSGASFATIDLPFYVAGMAIWGQRPSLLRDVPVVIYTVTVAIAALLARGRLRGPQSALGVAAVLVLLGLPAGGWAEFVTKGYIRVGTTLGLFAALLALDAPRVVRLSVTRVAIFFTLLALTFVSDPYALYVGAPALLLVCLLAALGLNSYGTLRVGPVSLAVVGAIAAANGLTWLIESLGGYQVIGGGLSGSLPWRDPLRSMINSAVHLANYLPDLYRCGLPAEITGKLVLLWVGCLFGPALALFALVRGCPISKRHGGDGPARPADFIADVLWWFCAIAIAAFIGRQSEDRAAIRYMIPFVLSGAVLTGRVLADRVREPRTAIAALALLGLAYGASLAADLQKPPANDPAKALAGWLDAQGLRHGYGPFWDASIVTAFGGGRVAVRPVGVRAISPQSHSIEPLRWMADERWFTEGPATFMVIEPGPDANYQFGIDEGICTKSFGPARARHVLEPYVVLVWDHDLRPLLNRESGP